MPTPQNGYIGSEGETRFLNGKQGGPEFRTENYGAKNPEQAFCLGETRFLNFTP